MLSTASARPVFLFELPSARTWHVKPDSTGDVPTIAAAIDSAQAGDEVVLAPGVYGWSSQGDDGHEFPHMIAMKTGVTLRSEAGPEATILDGEEKVSVVRCQEVGDVRIEGLTITGGSGVVGVGDGISSDGASHPVIINCVIRNNSSSSGAGILCVGATITVAESLTTCPFRSLEAGLAFSVSTPSSLAA